METMCFSSVTQNLDFNSNIIDQTFNFENIDDNDLINALKLSVTSGDLSPIIKKELKYFVQARRLADGKEEMIVNFSTPDKLQLEPKDEIKVARRREQNRRAAQKFRKKNRSRRISLDEELIREQMRNKELHNQANNLTAEVEFFREKICEILQIPNTNTMELESTTPSPEFDGIP